MCGSDRSLQSYLPLDDILLGFGDIRDQVAIIEIAENLMFLADKSLGCGASNF